MPNVNLLDIKSIKKELDNSGSFTVQSDDHNLYWILRESGNHVIIFNGQCFYSGKNANIAFKHFNKFNEDYIKKVVLVV